ncbi:hypothetical protein AB2L57_15460 [Microbacterium sp. HA-8]
MLPEDAPDPRVEQWQRIAHMPFLIFGFVPQPTLEEFGPSQFGTGSDGAGVRDGSVALGYTVIRHPENRSDPANLAELDDELLAMLDEVPPHPRPRWLIEQTDRLRYPMLWQAVRTSWHRDADQRPSIGEALVAHASSVLNQSFRRERGLEGRIGGLPPAPDLTVAAVQNDTVLLVDGVEHRAARIDTDPHVFVVGTALDDSTLVSVVVSRDELAYVRIELQRRSVSTNVR